MSTVAVATFVAAAIIIIALCVAVTVLLIGRRRNQQAESSRFLRQDIAELSKDMTQLKESLTENVNSKLDKNQRHMSETVQKQFSQSAKIISDISERLTKLDETNKRVMGVTDELKTLQNVLQNPKQRGVMGEYFLQNVLENVLPPERFAMQHKFKDGAIADACIFLEQGKILPVDSKFSLENYNRLNDTRDKTAREHMAKQVKDDLKTRIDETAKYIRPSEHTMDFAFMFIPSEALYYDLLTNKVGVVQSASVRDLIEYAFRDKHVIIVSPTSFMAYLQTVLQGLRSLQIEEQAKTIRTRVEELNRHLEAYDAHMQRLGRSIGTTVNSYNIAHKELQKVDKDVMRIADTAPAVDPISVDRPSQAE